MNYKDKNDITVKNGDIINLHQTVNGQSCFLVKTVSPYLDIRYLYDIDRKYEYDMDSLLNFSQFTYETEYEVINNIYNYTNI